MRAVNGVCLVLLGVLIASAKPADTSSAQRGDLVYVEETASGTSTLRVKSPSGVHRGSLRLTTDDAIFHNIGVSSDGSLAFLTTDRLYSDARTDIWVVALKNATPKVLSKHVLAPFMINSLAGCSTAGPAAIAAGLPAGGRFTIFVGLACNRGCSPKTNNDNYPVFSATWVLQLSYDVRTRTLTKTGATRTSVESFCKREIIDQVRALYVPRLPGGRNGAPLMVFGEHDALNFRFRGVKPGSPTLLSWRTGYAGECLNFKIGGPSEFYSFCPGRYTGLYGPGTIKQIKRTAKGQRVVTAVGRAPAALGRGFYNYGIATLEGASQPLYAVTAQDNDKVYVIKHSKAALGAAGKVALRATAGSQAS